MTCKDCIHEKACFAYNGGMARAASMGGKAETKCGVFKNKADFVELEAITAKTHTCPLFHDKNCVPMACGCGKVDMFTCRRLYRAYYMGCKAEAERIKAKQQREEAGKTAKLLGTSAKITIIDECPEIETNPVPLVTKNGLF